MKLLNKIKNKSAVVGVIGLGYVGLPLTINFVKTGFQVIGLDIDQEKIKKISEGLSYISHIADSSIKKLINSSFSFSSDYSQIKRCDVIIFCVPTPLNLNREPDLSFIFDTMQSIKPFLRKNQLISIESTTYPGMTEEIIATELVSLGYSLGEDYWLVYSPEREDPGNKEFSTSNIPKLVGGLTESCLEVGSCLYSKIIQEVIPVSSIKIAEMSKLLENIQRAVNIGLMNEMKMICTKMGIDIHEVIKAAETKPFGFVPYYPGPGIGGHCIPVDPFYLSWKAKEFSVNTKFIDLAGEVNLAMPSWIVSILNEHLNQRGKPLKDSKILILGIAYKKNVDDMRESPASPIMKLLQDQGAKLDYSDPFIQSFPKQRNYNFNLKSKSLTYENIKEYDAVVLITDHDKFDYDLIIDSSNLLIDTRGVYKEPRENLVKA